MGGDRKKKPKIAADGTIPVTVRLPPPLRERLYERASKDGMKLTWLIVRLLDFALEETETVLVRKRSLEAADLPAPQAGGGLTTNQERDRRGS